MALLVRHNPAPRAVGISSAFAIQLGPEGGKKRAQKQCTHAA